MNLDNKEQAKTRLEKLKQEMREIDYAYYVLDEPFVSDAVRDSLKDEVEAIENKYPDLITEDSPTQRIGGKALGKFKKVKHDIIKYSLDDVFSYDELIEFDKKVKRFLKLPIQEKISYTCELKIDGLNMSFHYKNGFFDRAVTRGDGIFGEDVSHTVKTIKTLPLKLREDLDIEVGGEVYMPKASFEKLNEKNAKLNKKLFANPRNAAAGTVRQLDPKVASDRDLNVFFWTIYNPQKKLKTQKDLLERMKKIGFRVNPEYKEVSGIEEAINFCNSWHDKRSKLPYDIDGVAIKVSNLDWQAKLGRANKYVRWAAAYKFPAEQATSVVEDIQWQVGRTGALTPVAHLRPVSLAGSIVSRATLHNFDEIKRKDVRIGDTVILEKAGDIIPEIIQTLPKLRNGDEKIVKMPQKCPICGGTVAKKAGEVAIYCQNKNCFAVEKEKISHFVSRKGFNIDGLGEKIVEQLINEGLITNAFDIFELKEGDLKLLERFADKSAENLIKAIQKSKKITLTKLIYALGIRHVGEETAGLLAENFSANTIKGFLQKLSKTSLDNLMNIEGIGDIVAESIYDYFHNEKNEEQLNRLIDFNIKLEKTIKNVNSVITNKTFVLTGSLKDLSRDEAKNLIKQNNGKVSSSVSSKTDFVVAGDEPGSKYDKAKKLGIKIINETEFLKLIKS